jgi:hypothetical protein
MDRITDPMGSDPNRRCREIWYYGAFPVVFIDETCTGNYDLVTYDLTNLRSFNLMYMQELSKAQGEAQQTIVSDEKLFNYEWKIVKTKVTPDRVAGYVIVTIPYGLIWFTEEDSNLTTTLELRLELKDDAKESAWQFDDDLAIVTDEEELATGDNNYSVKIPFVFTKNLERFRQGKSKMFISLKNLTGGEIQKKVLRFTL